MPFYVILQHLHLHLHLNPHPHTNRTCFRCTHTSVGVGLIHMHNKVRVGFIHIIVYREWV
jgi:hypothetical protein